MSETRFSALRVEEPSAKYIAELEPPLLRGFGFVATALGGVPKLRELIRSLAVRGLLVPQDPNDEPASALLRHNNYERPDADATSLPTGWEIVGFLDLCSVTGGSTPSKARADFWDGHIPWVSPKDMKRDVVGDAIDHVSEQALAETGLTMLPSGSVLIVVRGMILAHSFPTAITSARVAINQDMKALIPRIPTLAPYLALVCKGHRAQILSMVDRSTHGTCKLESSKLFGWRFGLPPLAEQHRIVARVEELMKLCDALEQSGRLADEQHARLTSTLFDVLAASESAHALAENWQRIAEHFDLLLDRPGAIDAFEQTILQLAVRGLLVAGHSESSEWAEPTLGSVVEFLNGYAFKSDWFRSKGIRLVRNVNVGHGKLSWSNGACVDDAVAQNLERFALNAGDLVISLDRPIISSGLKYAVVRECDLPCLLLQRVARMTPRAKVLDPAYLELWLRSPAFIGSIDPGRSNGVPHISTRQLEAIPLLLPPFAEQHRIVARVEELRRLCAQLRERLTAARRTQSQLADALVVQAVG